MYGDDEQLEQFKAVWLTEKAHKIIKLERGRLKKENDREVSMAKIINNLILEKYEK
jgi:hypothetical protein